LPTFKSKNVKRRKPLKVRVKGAYTPFPPAPVMSKKDLEIESGEYFKTEEERVAAKRAEKRRKREENSALKQEERVARYAVPA